MDRILEDEVFGMNQNRRGPSVRPCGSNSVEGFSQKLRSGREPRKQKGVSNLGTRGRNWEDVSEAKSMVRYKKINRAGIGCGARKMKARPDSIDRIQHKLQSLEEDIWLLKKVFLRRVEERAALMNEVVQQFHIITERLGSLKANCKSLGDHSLAIPHKVGSKKVGLSEVLHQDLAPSVITRDMKVNLNTFQVHPGIYEDAAGNAC